MSLINQICIFLLKLFYGYIFELLNSILIVFLVVQNLPHFKVLSLALELVSCFFTNSLDVPLGIVMQLMVVSSNIDSMNAAKYLTELFMDFPYAQFVVHTQL